MSATLPSETPRARALLKKALDAQRLDWAALAIALLEYPDLDVRACEAQLDAFAQRVLAVANDAAEKDTLAQVTALRRVLGDEEGFWGNTERYTAPDNSFLNVVLDRKIGLPISLSVLYLEVARRAGIPLFGVSFPGHFLVACEAAGGKLVMDPYQGGQILTEAGCADLLRRVAPQVKFVPRMLTGAPVKTIAARMLNNLKRTYLDAGDGGRALRVVDLLLLLNPDHPGELRARATILSALGAYRAALKDVERCLELSPDAPDHQSLRVTLRALRQRVDFLN